MKKSKLKALHIMHNLCTDNQELIKLTGAGTCIECGYMGTYKDFEYLKDGSAICPSCGVDMVIPNTNTIRLETKMREFWL